MPVPLTGYLDCFSAKPGERIDVKVSSSFPDPYDARLVRIRCGDPNPQGPGQKIIDHGDVFHLTRPSRHQPVHLGSYIRVPADPRLAERPLTWTALVQPTRVGAQPTAIMAQGSLSLVLTAGGITAQDGPIRVEAKRGIRERVWYRVWLARDGASLTVGIVPLDETAPATTARAAGGPVTSLSSVLLIGARGSTPADHFEGKIEAPAVLRGVITDPMRLAAPVDADIVAAWDFSVGIDTRDIHDTGRHGLHGAAVNMPTRGVRGARWSGREMCWRHAPSDYAAIAFHADDLEDCGWATDFSFTVPTGLKSGVYGFKLSCAGATDIIPFYVRPADNGPRAKVAFLASTFTYQAYANHLRRNFDDAFEARVKAWGAYPWNADRHSEFSHSTYNRHPDNSGITYSSRLRPILTMRPGYLTFNDARGSGLRHFPADSHLTDWLEAKGIDFDVVTDEDLDDEGAALLAPYKVVLTGSHPEYHTGRNLDAIQAYKAQGGRLCYLGGNGFYWRIARNPAIPHMIEVRRAEGGIRAWAAEPGEYYHSLDGQYGGLWRRNMRAPQSIGGVGFSAQGLFEGSHYRRMPASRDPRFGWMFAGIDSEIIGDFGLSGGGAAGFELDRADTALGTPPETVILARSEGHQSHFVAVPEELLSHVNTITGESAASLIRGEIVYCDLPNSGALFAVGSITFCGSLAHNGYANNVSRLLENVVRRFMAD